MYPTISDNKTNDGSGKFVSSIIGLNQGTKYYIRAYAVNSIGVEYGAEVKAFTTPSLPTASLPTIRTSKVSTLSPTSATSGGLINSDGVSTITACGVCCSTSHNPTVVFQS